MAGFVNSWLGAPEGLDNDPAAGLLGNSAFRLGLGLLQARYNGRINPATAGLEGLLGAQQFRGEYLTQQEQLSQMAADKALRASFPKLLDPTDPTTQLFRTQARNVSVDPNSPTGAPMAEGLEVGGLLSPPTPQPGPGSLIDPQSRQLIGEMAKADPKSALAAYTSILGDETRPSSLHQPKGTVGSAVLLGNGHPGIVRVNPDNPAGAPRMWDLTENDWAAPGVGLAVQPGVMVDPSGQGWTYSKTSGPTLVPGMSSADVQGRKNTADQMAFEHGNFQQLPALENRYDQLESMVDYLEGRQTPLSTGFASYFPTLRGSSTAGWEAQQRTFNSSQTLGTLREMKAQTQTGASGLGNTNQYEIQMLEAAGSRMSTAQGPEDFKEAAKDFRYWLKRSRGIARKQAGLEPTDTSQTATELLQGMNIAPNPPSTSAGGSAAPKYLNPATQAVPPAPPGETYDERMRRLGLKP